MSYRQKYKKRQKMHLVYYNHIVATEQFNGVAPTHQELNTFYVLPLKFLVKVMTVYFNTANTYIDHALYVSLNIFNNIQVENYWIEGGNILSLPSHTTSVDTGVVAFTPDSDFLYYYFLGPVQDGYVIHKHHCNIYHDGSLHPIPIDFELRSFDGTNVGTNGDLEMIVIMEIEIL